MKTTRIVLKGQATVAESTDKKQVLLCLELIPENNQVQVRLLQDASTDEIFQEIKDAWAKQGQLHAILGEVEAKTYELSAAEPLFPAFEGIEFEGFDEERQRNEWLLLVLSTKLFKSYQSEVESLEDRVDVLEAYDKNLWEELKTFWAKVQQQQKDKNLNNEQVERLREKSNGLFDKMKNLRAAEDARFEAEGQSNFEVFSKEMSRIEEVLASVNPHLNTLFNDLKEIQKRFHGAKLGRKHRSELWDRIDQSFKALKEKRNQNTQNAGAGNEQRLSKRIEGLKEAVQRMEQSIQRDDRDLQVQSRKADSSTANQLETQLAEVRIKLVKDRIESKNEKLKDMKKTLSELEERLKRMQVRAAKAQKHSENSNEETQGEQDELETTQEVDEFEAESELEAETQEETPATESEENTDEEQA